jgi:lipid A 3-O-deacylase
VYKSEVVFEQPTSPVYHPFITRLSPVSGKIFFQDYIILFDTIVHYAYSAHIYLRVLWQQEITNMSRAKSFFFLLLISSSVIWANFSIAADADSEEVFPGNDQRHLREAAKYRFEFDNDVLVDSDNGFSNGWSFQIHTPVAESWDKVEGPAPFIKELGAWLPSLSGDDLNYRVSLAIGQIIQTPNDLDTPLPIPNDVPYMGLLTAQLGLIAYNDDEFRGFGFVLGVVGPPAMAEQAQNFVHNVINVDLAQGWDNQLKTEPVFNMTYMRKKKFYRTGDYKKFAFDAAVSGDIELGTMFTGAGIRLETRFGKNMPGGFGFYSDPIGRWMSYDATLAPLESKQSSIYGTFAVSASGVAHNISLDGTTFRDNPPSVDTVDKETLVGHIILGFHYERPTWGFHFEHFITTDVTKKDSTFNTDDPDNNFSSIMFEWRI